MRRLCKTVLLSNSCIFTSSKSSNMVNMLRFRSRSSFDLEQNPWFCKAFYEINTKLFLSVSLTQIIHKKI